ncbi:MAG: hypothetical protein QOD71_296 [Thermoleophilaceae bacterium]|nr:hypothetical protein [Thermoleophilaceae bacterium]
MSLSLPERSIGWRELFMPHDWEERVAREVEFQARIEATFDRADAYGRRYDFEHALEWLDRASALTGGLSPTYRRRRANFARQLERKNV